MKKIHTLIFASLFAFSFLAPLSAQEDIMPLSVQEDDNQLDMSFLDEEEPDFPGHINPDTDNTAIIIDDADIISDDKEENLLDELIPVTNYSNVLLYTMNDDFGMSTQELAEDFIGSVHEESDSVVGLFINMSKNDLYILTSGDIKEKINADKVQGIVDSILETAGSGDFYGCVKSAFNQISSLLSDASVSAPYEPLTYTNSETSLSAKVMDEADILSDEDEKTLLVEMQKMTQWGNALFYTTTQNAGVSSQELAEITYKRVFGSGTDGSIFLIDMNQRRLEIYSDGAVYGTITTDYAQTITDNIYKTASGGNYFDCASEAFKQMTTLLAGGKIRQPMKYISNYLLALALALIICYFYMRSQPKTSNEKAQPKADPVFNGKINNISVTKGRLSSRVIQSSSGGGRSGGGGGGGGHSGGGGGHSF